MHIHRLELEAIGPFAGRHRVDVDALSAGGLFLLEGPTGAGKSTIIDAVVFALYGQVAAEGSSSDRLHSDHAAPGTEPYVDMVFSTAAGIYRIWRSPKFERPKQRGTGTVTQNARAKLWRLTAVDDDPGEVVSAQVQEVGGELGRIVALDRTQFTQTVVLPQGQFASFLRARPEDRRAVLQEVFGTRIYEQVQHQLVEMAKDARARLSTAGAEVGSAVAAFAQAAGLDEDERAVLETAARELDTAALAEHAAAVCERTQQTADRAAEAESVARAGERRAQEQLDAGKDLAARLHRRAELLAQQRRLEEQATDAAERLDRLDRARRAAPVMPCVRTRARAAQRHTGALQDLAAGLGSLHEADAPGLWQIVGAVAPAELDGGHLAGVSELLDRYADERGALAELVTLESGLAARSQQLDADGRAIEQAVAQVSKQRELLESRPSRRAELTDAASTARERAAGLPGARSALEAAHARAAAAERVSERAAALARAEEAAARAAAVARAAMDTEHELRRRWVDGIAGELATTLTDHAPCPVCGSAEHPHPARPAAEHPTTEQVEDAAAARQRAERALATARTEQVRVEEQVRAAQDGTQGRDLEQARTEVRAATDAVTQAEVAAEQAERLQHELAGFDADTERRAEALTELRTDLAARTERLGSARASLTTDRGRCAAAAGTARSVAERAEHLNAQVRAGRQLADLLAERLAAGRALSEAEDALAHDLAEAGFDTAAAAQAGAMPPEDIIALEEQINAYRAAISAVAGGLAEQRIAELTGAESAGVEEAAAAHARAQEEAAEATRRCTAASSRAQEAAAARQALARALERHRERAAEAAPVLRMANLATATEGNGSSTTLATFVLLRRFEDVVAAANERLSVMSDGRYALERIDTEGHQRSRKAGLGLQVRDHVTETPRDPHTLSGGETFYVSLCLALGLADVVRSEAGGIELGTLFVDEGFGSLDPETLDDVMAELGRLQRGGRAVGVVSHVTELKDRITERIEVRRLPGGASTLTVRA